MFRPAGEIDIFSWIDLVFGFGTRSIAAEETIPGQATFHNEPSCGLNRSTCPLTAPANPT